MRALLLVDIQNDFMPFGALPVSDGDAVVPVANAIAPCFELVVATQDWHPAGHGSFASTHPGKVPGDVIDLNGITQVLWPDHCVQNSPGASFHSGFNVAHLEAVVRKGSDPGIDSYSGFFDNGHRVDTGLAALLRERGVGEIWIAGLATDYCVKYTALDAIAQGFSVVVVRDGVRAVELAEGDGEAALSEMADAGCRLSDSAEVLARG